MTKRPRAESGQAQAEQPRQPSTVFICLESESDSQYSDIVSVVAVVDSVEAARLVCRDRAMQKRESDCFFDCNEPDPEKWVSCYDSGVYDDRDWNDYNKYRYKVWFEGSYAVKSVADIPQHPFPAEEEEKEEED
jgi:hypothetical protein